MEIEKHNAEEVACNFVDWLIEMDYMEMSDKETDLEEIIADFIKAQKEVPKLFNLLRVMSEH